MDSATPEKAQWRRRAAARSSRLSDAVLRSAGVTGHTGPTALRACGCQELDRRNRGVRRLRLRDARVQLRTLSGAEERHRLGVPGVESQGRWLRELWLRHGR